MDCPYCTGEIKEYTLACRHCGRDVSPLVVRDVGQKLESLADRIGAVEKAVEALSRQLGALPAGGASQAPSPRRLAARILGVWAWLALVVVLLLMAHWIVVVALDLDARILRIVSVFVPCLFGLRRLHSLTATLWAALAISVSSVTGMLFLTSLVDHGPVLPQDVRGWVETVQYVVSIGLGYLVGSLVADRWRLHRASPGLKSGLLQEMAAALAQGSAPAHETRAHLHRRVAAIAGWINSTMIALTAAGAVITALAKLWD